MCKGDYANALFKNELAVIGITYEPVTPFSQWMNGVSERSIRTNAEMARSMLFDASTDYEDRSKFWPEAIAAAAYT